MSDRQEAEEFAASLADVARGAAFAEGGTRRGAAGAGPDLLVALAGRLGAAGRELPGPSAEFRAELRATLLEAAAATATVPAQRSRGGRSGARHSAPDARPRTFGGFSAAWRRRLLAAGVGVAVATGSVGGIAIASAGAEPGDPLYNAKKIFENLQLSLSGSPTDQGRDYLHLADIRLGEIDSLLRRGDVDTPDSPTQLYLQQTLGELRTMIFNGGNLLIGQVRADGDQTALHALADFLLTERQRVADLTWRLPPSLQSQPPQIVALMDQLNRQLQLAAAEQAERSQHGSQGPGQSGGSGGRQGGPGAQGQGNGATGADPSTSARPGAGGTGAATTGGAGAGGSGATAGTTGSSSSAASPSAASTIGIGVTVPLPIPSIGVTLPGLLGLPAVDLGVGDNGDAGGATPTPTPAD